MSHEINHRSKSRRASRVRRLSEGDLGASSDQPAFGSDNWMQVQQIRCEREAAAWRLLREDLRANSLAADGAKPPIDYDHRGSATLTALVRFGLATLGAHLAGLMAVAGQVGQFELWLAMTAGFVITLALSMFSAARGFVHLLAQAAGWMIVAGVSLSGMWLAFQFLR